MTQEEKDQFWRDNAEYPFVRKGMGSEEYHKEFVYYLKNYPKVLDGTYKPLWQQNK